MPAALARSAGPAAGSPGAFLPWLAVAMQLPTYRSCSPTLSLAHDHGGMLCAMGCCHESHKNQGLAARR